MFEVLIIWCPFKKLYKIVQKLTYLVSLRLSVIGRYIWCRCIKKKESYDWVISFIHVIDSNISKFCRNTPHLIASTFELFSNFTRPTIGLLVIPCKWLLVYMPRYHWNIEVKIIIYRQKRLQRKAYMRTYTHTLCVIWRWHPTLDGCVVNVVVTRFIKCCCTFLKLTRGYTGVDMVSGHYILIAPAMGKLQNFLLIILCGNDCKSGFYDKSNAFIFFYLHEEFIEATNSFSFIFYFVLVKFFFCMCWLRVGALWKQSLYLDFWET